MADRPRRTPSTQFSEGRRSRREPPRRAPRTRRSGSGSFWLRPALALVAIIVAALLVWFLIELFQPLHGAGHGRVEVTVPENESVGALARTLQQDGVIDSTFFFKLRATLNGDRGKLYAGPHKLQLGMSDGAALKVLTMPPPPVKTTNVTITPGHSRQQLDKLLRSQHVKGSYLNQTEHSPLLNPVTYGAPASTPSLEGFLFPDTYNLRDPLRTWSLVADQLKTFKVQFAKVNFGYAESKNLTPYDVLIIASLIQEESYRPSDGPKVASVIYNRLKDGMDLGLDSTVAYATGNYGALTDKDLSSSSPWNTTNHVGLPPTPIDSPGLATINYAAHPATTNYLYFIDKVCGNGALRFTTSYARFTTWETAWTSAVEKAEKDGGSAEFCKNSPKSNKKAK